MSALVLPMLIFVGAKQLDLSWHVEDFRKVCYTWDQYKNDVNALHIAHKKK